MSKLLMALGVGSVCGRTIGVSHPPEELATYTPEAWDIGFAQGFIWYPHYVLFFPPVSLGSYWVEIYTCDPLRLQPETIRAIAVPFTVPKGNQIYISGSDDLGTAISIAQGSYQLLFETGATRFCGVRQKDLAQSPTEFCRQPSCTAEAILI